MEKNGRYRYWEERDNDILALSVMKLRLLERTIIMQCCFKELKRELTSLILFYKQKNLSFLLIKMRRDRIHKTRMLWKNMSNFNFKIKIKKLPWQISNKRVKFSVRLMKINHKRFHLLSKLIKNTKFNLKKKRPIYDF